MKFFNEVNDPQTNAQIEAIEKEFDFRFPPLFREFILTYYPYQFSVEVDDNSKIIIYQNLFQEKIFIPRFVDLRKVQANIEVNFESDESDFGWELIKVLDSEIDPYAGFFVGIGEHNLDIIYYIKEDDISPEYEYPINTEELQHCLKPSITRLTKDIYSFTKFLQIVPNQFELVDFEWE